MSSPRIALIGCGNMGRCLAGGLIRSGWAAGALCGVDPDPGQCERMRRETGIDTTAAGHGAVLNADAILLAVKPQAMAETVRGLANALQARRPLIITVAAGIRLDALARWVGAPMPMVRAMPNTPALIGAGATGLFCGAGVSAEQRSLTERILGAVGLVQWVDHEELLDVITALSGSGPAYFLLLMEGLIQAAVRHGLTPEQARLLTVHTALGTARMVAAGADSPEQLRRQVTSPGGTTEQAVRVLEESGLRDTLARALAAAQRRAAELARQFGTG